MRGIFAIIDSRSSSESPGTMPLRTFQLIEFVLFQLKFTFQFFMAFITLMTFSNFFDVL